MFNEVSYKPSWQGRHRDGPLPTHINSVIPDTGGTDVAYAPGYGPGVVENPGFRAPGYGPRPTGWPAHRGRPPVAIVPVADPATPSAAADTATNTPTASGFDLSSITSIFSGLETWQLIALAGAVWYFFLRKGR